MGPCCSELAFQANSQPLRHSAGPLPHMEPMCTQSVLQSHGNFIVSVGRVVGRASVMIEAQEAATEGTHVAVPEGLVPEAIQGVD